MSFEVERAFGFLAQQIDSDVQLDLIRAIVQAHESSKKTFPQSREVGRVGDMAPLGKSHMRIVLDGDSDACVEIWDDEHGQCARASIEFCTSFGGGKSPHTRDALVSLMVAM